MKWGLLAAGLLALLIVVAVAIAVPVSKQNAAKRRTAAQATGLKGPRGAPLTFKVDVQVPPDPSPGSGPVCGTLFGGSGDKMVEVSACTAAVPAQKQGCNHLAWFHFSAVQGLIRFPACVFPAVGKAHRMPDL
jgi:hypothetical protein